MILQMLPLLEEAGHEPAGAGPYLIGIGTLVLLFSLMFALIAFGNGREHS
ncbi:hypothetical protein GCM10027425_07440 [Alteromonas gracilis]